jgi:DNA helicase IV
LTDRGLVRVLYVAPSRKLVRKKNADYAITSDVLANLIINDSIKYNKIARFFNVLVLDEVSMYSEKNKQAIFSRFEYHKLIFCGDVGCQLPTWDDEPITTKGFDLVKTHTENYRIQCPELQQLCQMIRDLITIVVYYRNM